MRNNVIIIAEAGVNHNGDLQIAKDLIYESSKAGADFVKFQTFKSGDVISKRAPQAEYQIKNTNNITNQLEMVSRLELSEADHHELNKVASECNIQLFSTAFDAESLHFLEQFMRRSCVEYLD